MITSEVIERLSSDTKELFDFYEPIILSASELGKGKHKITAEVFASWNKHHYTDGDKIKLHSKEIEIDIN